MRRPDRHRPDRDPKAASATLEPCDIMSEPACVSSTEGDVPPRASARAKCGCEEAMRASEQRFHRIFTLSRDMLCVGTFEGQFTEVNPAWERTLGWAPHELVSRPFVDFVHPEDREFTAARMRALVERPETACEPFENRFQCRDGSYRWLLWDVQVSEPERLVFAVARDVTDQRRVHEQLIESEERFRALVESASIAIVACNARGHVILVNATAEKLFGYERDEIVGKSIEILVPDGARPRHSQVREEFTANPHMRVMGSRKPLSAQRKDGSVFPCEISLSHIRTREGMVILSFIVDITERRKMERMKDEFISIVSHELRTPLTSIRASLGLLAAGIAGAVPDKAQRMLDIAVSNTDRLVRLINDILDIERLDSGRATLERKACPIPSLIEQCLQLMQAMADREGVELVPLGLDGRVWAEEDLIIQTLTNLVSNAVKFSPRGAAVEIGAEQTGEGYRFFVRDQGRGIPEDMLETVFEHFQQVDASDSREKGGTGLGLAISRSIIRQHGGEIWVESKVGQGSTFFFTLPAWIDAPKHA